GVAFRLCTVESNFPGSGRIWSSHGSEESGTTCLFFRQLKYFDASSWLCKFLTDLREGFMVDRIVSAADHCLHVKPAQSSPYPLDLRIISCGEYIHVETL